MTVVDRNAQLADPTDKDALDVVLPQPEPVRVPSGKVADVQGDAGEPRDLGRRSFREEPIRDSTLVENLDGARRSDSRRRSGSKKPGPLAGNPGFFFALFRCLV